MLGFFVECKWKRGPKSTLKNKRAAYRMAYPCVDKKMVAY